MSLSIGGYIRQKIISDPHSPGTWDVNRIACFNVHILNAKSFKKITGYPLPPTPIDAESYAKLNLPYFEDLEESPMADLQPDTVWEQMESISQILRINEKSVEMKVNPVGPLRAFSSFLLMKAECSVRYVTGMSIQRLGGKVKKEGRCVHVKHVCT